MLFPFRTSAIFRNRWVALLWAVGICFMASEIVDGVAGVTNKGAKPQAVDAQSSTPAISPNDAPYAVAASPSQPAPPPSGDHPAL